MLTDIIPIKHFNTHIKAYTHFNINRNAFTYCHSHITYKYIQLISHGIITYKEAPFTHIRTRTKVRFIPRKNTYTLNLPITNL